MRNKAGLLSTLIVSLAVAPALGCEKSSETVSPDAAAPDAEPAETPATAPAASLDEVLAGGHRSDENKARDAFRHPKETLEFFGIAPNMTVVELWPGGSGWYTEVLAPYVREEGKLIATNYNTEGDPESYGVKSGTKFMKKLQDSPEVYDRVDVVPLPAEITGETKLTLAAPGSVDMVLTFRNSHGWFGRGQEKVVYGAAFEALKPGGILGVVQHRADAGTDPKETAEQGYVAEESVISAIEAAGFELVEKSEINANPKDTKNYEKGVWTLPPGYALGDTDRDKYTEIGESDRMTLKFHKP